MEKATWLRQEWQYHLELPKLCYPTWLAADESRLSHIFSRVVSWKKLHITNYVKNVSPTNIDDLDRSSFSFTLSVGSLA